MKVQCYCQVLQPWSPQPRTDKKLRLADVVDPKHPEEHCNLEESLDKSMCFEDFEGWTDGAP